MFISELYLADRTQLEIAQLLDDDRSYTVTRQTVGKDIAELHRRWFETSMDNVDQKKAIELAKINNAERRAWVAWELSLQDKERRTVSTGPQGGTIDMTETQSGNPRYLDIVLHCIEKRCKLLGLNAPTKISPTDPSGTKPYERPPTVAELMRKINALGEEIAGQAPYETPTG